MCRAGHARQPGERRCARDHRDRAMPAPFAPAFGAPAHPEHADDAALGRAARTAARSASRHAAAAMQDHGHPEHQRIAGGRDREIGRAQPEIALREQGGHVRLRRAGFGLRMRGAQRSLVGVRQPACVVRPVVEKPQRDETEHAARQPFHEEQPLPAAQAAAPSKYDRIAPDTGPAIIPEVQRGHETRTPSRCCGGYHAPR